MFVNTDGPRKLVSKSSHRERLVTACSWLHIGNQIMSLCIQAFRKVKWLPIGNQIPSLQVTALVTYRQPNSVSWMQPNSVSIVMHITAKRPVWVFLRDAMTPRRSGAEPGVVASRKNTQTGLLASNKCPIARFGFNWK